MAYFEYNVRTNILLRSHFHHNASQDSKRSGFPPWKLVKMSSKRKSWQGRYETKVYQVLVGNEVMSRTARKATT